MATDQEFIKEYLDLLIIQYSDSIKAVSETTLKASSYSKIFSFYNSFFDAFDVDHAVGDQLDIIGKIVGIKRNVPFVLEKIRFGFEGDDSARGMADIFDASVESAVFFDIFEGIYTSQQLEDEDFKLFIKAKIVSNVASAYMVSDDRLGINEVIQSLMQGAYVVDNNDMSLLLFVPSSIDDERIRLIEELDLLPKPQGVRYRLIRFFEEPGSFGFEDDSFALGFGDAFDPSIGGTFAEFIFI